MRLNLFPLVAVSVGLAPLGCSRQPAAPAGAAAPPPTGPQVRVVKPEMRAVERVVDQPGTVRAFEEAALLAKLTGYVGAIAADPDKKDRPTYDRQIDRGSRVKKGQVLAELSVPELGQEAKQKEALVESAGAEVTQAEKALAAAESTIEAATSAAKEAVAGVAKTKADVERWRLELAQSDDLVSQKLLDAQSRAVVVRQLQSAEATRTEADARVESAAAAVRKAKADRDRVAADVLAAKARRKVAEANLGEVAARQSYLTIKAPFDGVVTSRTANTGDLVSATEKVSLFVVARIDPVRAVVLVPEADAWLVAPGQAVTVAIQAVPGASAAGKVARTSWSLEPGSRTLWTEIDLPNEKGLLRPGMYVNARLTAALPAAWAVPAAAVGKAGDDAVIYLAEGGKAVRVPVQLGRGDGQFTQVLRYKKPGAADWAPFTGTEPVATPAAGVSDGQALP